jgi:hypothetical protein
MKNLVKKQHGAGGFQFFTTENKGNIRLGEAKQIAIIKTIEDRWTEGVYQTAVTGLIKRQLLNGNSQFLTKDSETGEYYFS